MKKYKHTVFLKRIILHFTIILFVFGCAFFKTAEKDSGSFNPEESLKKANELIESKSYEEARTILEDIKAKDASQQYAALARLRIADTYFEAESYEEAASGYEAFLEADKYNKFASYAQYKLAMSFFKQIKQVDISYSTAQRALTEFEKLQRDYPRNPYMEVTETRIKACRRMFAEHEFYVGDFYIKKGAYEAAARRFNSLLDNYPDSEKEPEALYLLGISYENMGQRGQAIKTLTLLTKKFPSFQLSNEVKKYLASSAFLIIKSDNVK